MPGDIVHIIEPCGGIFSLSSYEMRHVLINVMVEMAASHAHSNCKCMMEVMWLHVGRNTNSMPSPAVHHGKTSGKCVMKSNTICRR